MQTWRVIETIWDEDNRMETPGWKDGWATKERYTVQGTTEADARNVVMAREGCETFPVEYALEAVPSEFSYVVLKLPRVVFKMQAMPSSPFVLGTVQ